MRKLIYILTLAVVFVGCQPKLKPVKPDNLIAQDKMVEVLSDMFVMTSAKGVNRKKLEENNVNPEKYLLEKHNIDSTQFAQSNDYYAHDMEVYTAIIEEVKSKLSAEKERYVAIEKEEKEKSKRIKDSIRKVKVEQRANPDLENNSSLKKQN